MQRESLKEDVFLDGRAIDIFCETVFWCDPVQLGDVKM